MAKPTAAELHVALEKAIAMRESGQDPDFVAKALLNLHYRTLKLERTLEAAKRYMHSGQGTAEHRLLLQAIHDAEAACIDLDAEERPIPGRSSLRQ
jgi:hypothetical protein